MSAPNIPQIRLYQDWLRETRGLVFDSYDALWRWSVTEIEEPKGTNLAWMSRSPACTMWNSPTAWRS